MGACGGASIPAVDSFEVVFRLDVGRNPHQISFSEDGRTAYVATAGENRITVVDAVRYEIAGTIDVPGTPLGGDLPTSAGASLIVGPYAGDRYLVSIEAADTVHVFDGSAFAFVASYATGDRPFPAAATSDGRLAFVPGYADGTVTIIDLFNDRVLETISVGTNPSGGAVLPGDIEYAVVVRGENRVTFINTASHQVVDHLTDGIGESPFSIVIAPNGRLAFVNNTASNDVSVIDLAERRVIQRIPVPETPIVMAVHPSGRELWVSSEGVHRLTVISIPDAWRDDPRNLPSAAIPDSQVTEVAVVGMIHSAHETSELWGLDQVEQTIRNFRPDVVCAEIAPDRWERIERDLRERDAIADPRVLRFPEYTGVILRLSISMGFTVAPCAGWTLEMSDLRNTRIAAFEREPRWAASRDEYQNDMIGPGGWTNINVEHYRNVDLTIQRHHGARILVTFGGGHKYWLLERLRERDDITLLDLRDFLPN